MRSMIAYVLVLIIFISSCTYLDDLTAPEEKIRENITNISEEKEPEKQGFWLEAEKKNNKVFLEWNRYEGEDFKFYKIVRTSTDATPTYAEAGYIETIGFINTTTYIDDEPLPGISYYGVTAVSRIRDYTESNPVKIIYPDPGETPDRNITLDAKKTKDGVLLEWDRYDGRFLQYKIVRASKHPYPKYPDDRLLDTIPFVDETQYIDRTVEPGNTYWYAVTIIRPDNSRFTSGRDSVSI